MNAQEILISSLIDGRNARKASDPEKDRELTESIRKYGVLQPILTVRLNGEQEQIIAGFRRTHCAKAAGLTTIPRICLGSIDDTEQRCINLIENIQRADLSPMDAARGAAYLVKSAGCTAAEAAKRLGVSEPTMSRWLTLASAPPEIQAKVERGELGIVAACQAVRAAANEVIDSSESAARKGLLSPKGLARKVNRIKRTQGRRTPRSPDRIALRTADGYTVGVTGRVMTLETLIAAFAELLSRANQVHAAGLDLKAFVEGRPNPSAERKGGAT